MGWCTTFLTSATDLSAQHQEEFLVSETITWEFVVRFLEHPVDFDNNSNVEDEDDKSITPPYPNVYEYPNLEKLCLTATSLSSTVPSRPPPSTGK